MCGRCWRAREWLSGGAIDEAAAELGVSRRQMYVLLQRFRAGSGRATDLMPASPDGGRGRGRLDYRVEAIVAETIRKRFLSRQKCRLPRSMALICLGIWHPVPLVE